MHPFRQTRRSSSTPALAVVAGLVVVGALAVAPLAHAQAGSPNVVIAEKLFHEGQELLAASKTDDSQTHPACEKFAESERLRPALGTLLNLAVCHEKEKKTASAWAEYTEVAGQATRAGQADRAQFASEHAKALEQQLCRLRLEMSAPPPGTEIKIDGSSLGTAVWGTDIPLDPGTHAVVVSAPGKQPWSRNILLGPDKTMDREEVPALLDEKAAAAGHGGVDSSGALRPDGAPSESSDHRSLGYIVGGVGGVAVVVGGIFIGRGVAYGSRASSETSQAAALPATSQNAQILTSAASSAKSAQGANLAGGAVVGGLGLVGVGVGLYFILTSPSKEAPPKAGALRFVPDVDRGRAGGSLAVTF